jgi:hypothetical protein
MVKLHYEARGSIVIKALWCKSEGRGFETRWGEWIFFSLPNPSGRHGAYLASNRNKHQKHKNNVSGE